MSAIAPTPAETPEIETDRVEEKRLRAIARRRALYCPGAGWAYLGYGGRGALVLAAFAAFWLAFVWMVSTLDPASLWTAGVTLALAVVLWVAEVLDVGWCRVRQPRAGFLVRRFAITTFVVIAMVVAVPPLVLTRFGSIEVADDRMAPLLEPGERLVYHRRVANRDLREGTVVVYRLPSKSKVGTPGELAIGRILAVPDDELATERGHYVVNGKVTRCLAETAPPGAPLEVPQRPRSLEVPTNRYFLVQDSSSTGIDSQQLGFIHRGDVISTRLFHLGRGGLLRAVE